ncbi:hypothetical protein ACJMK2_007147 [Sinanodonta woodiana]|uniref:Uncharacterized protein n=1 Tax=Sinanodonta woodiana TaxID=1069815 RepID=A0ABD3VIQ6_SINWO
MLIYQSVHFKTSGDIMNGIQSMRSHEVYDLETTYPPINCNQTQAVSYSQLKSFNGIYYIYFKMTTLWNR